MIGDASPLTSKDSKKITTDEALRKKYYDEAKKAGLIQ